ncbi:alpha/beta hydrolase [Amycolatopsis granulosa]|uniref:alpha/beta hydrolase n=1 Tax=Amycolatopsis granulosa TaxID=185684 RepID=UPI0014219DFF|nr:alpha/beta hydrolase [Amycolatopsis granulosa]NIH88356.1 acetyl esterase [Amycolatopsis granulosa]
MHPAIAEFLDQHGRDGLEALLPEKFTPETVARTAAALRARDEQVTVPGRQTSTAAEAWDERVGNGPLVRIYRVPDPDAQPAVLFLHGGGWMTGGLGTQDHACRRLAAAGVTVVSLDYRLAPEHPFPAALDDCATAMTWMVREAGRLGISMAGGVAVVGCSAGGTLAAALSLRSRTDPGLPVTLQVLVYPALDPTRSAPSHRTFASGFSLTSRQVRFYWHAYAAGHLDNPLAAPATCRELGGAPPAVVLTAECDPLRDEAERYAARLAAAGVPVVHRRYPGMIHGFLRLHDIVPDADEAVDYIARAVGTSRRGATEWSSKND